MQPWPSSSAGNPDLHLLKHLLFAAIRQYDFRRLFADHVGRTGDKKSWNAGEDRGVDHPQGMGLMHPEIAVQNSIFFEWPDGAATRGVMTPRVGPNIFFQLFVGFEAFAG